MACIYNKIEIHTIPELSVKCIYSSTATVVMHLLEQILLFAIASAVD